MASTILDVSTPRQLRPSLAATRKTLITLRHVCKLYRTSVVETTALDDVSLDIRTGEFLAVMGPSGCGKSTLLNIIALLDAPTDGSYLFDEVEVSGATEERLTDLRKETIGFVFQSFNLIEDLTVYENVELPLAYRGVPRKQRHEQVLEALTRVDLLARADHWPGQLSGGQQQRVAVARAIVVRPKLIVADEPTGNLDTRNGEEVMDILQGLHAGGATILMVTHSASHAARAERVVHMLDGRIVRDESAAT